MKNSSKIQQLLINHLLRHGQLELLLPDGIKLEIGITQFDQNNEMVKTNDYCWVMATKENKSISLDSFNLALRYPEDNSTIIFEDEFVDQEGKFIHHLELV